MKGIKGKLLVNVKLPDDFLTTIRREIGDEIIVAQNKWNISFATPNESLYIKNLVTNKTLEQLKAKTLSVFGREWDFSDNITILVNSYATNEITLPDETVDINFVRQGQNWCIDSERVDSINSIPASKFTDEIIKLLKNWARTGAFYGIGSFA